MNLEALNVVNELVYDEAAMREVDAHAKCTSKNSLAIRNCVECTNRLCREHTNVYAVNNTIVTSC